MSLDSLTDFSKFPFRLSLVKPPSVHEPTPGRSLQVIINLGALLLFFLDCYTTIKHHGYVEIISVDRYCEMRYCSSFQS